MSTETMRIAAFRLVDGQVIVGQVPYISTPADEDGLMTDYTVQNPAIYAVMQKAAVLAGDAPKAVPAMQKYRVLPLLGEFATELHLQYSQIIGFPAEITDPDVLDVYRKVISSNPA